ncbi:hypothetical protein SLS62_000945 [Diatrype stigma]|uniref:Mitochondrial outer membrane transport complex Sam37/metaxin N-terminal domain-containing protein n=1 Tax=Diatrype stigma TaxID=117547 RepID=A0AAN9V9C0_9PEZI
MALKLHVWGPAFGLSSIDPECLAAISYFQYTVPCDDWTLIASNDTSVSPDHVLPALSHRGTWTSGYANIVSYLAKHTSYSIDNDLTPLQKADSLACASYLTMRGSALLAMSLYVSPAAWARLTRPAYSSLLPFPLTWTVPPALRAAAVDKVEHLGLGHLAAEVDNADPSTDAAATTTSTGFLRLPERFSPSSTLKPEQTAAIRLQGLAGDFFSVLDDLRGAKKYFLRDENPSSLDFLAYGYLALMQVQTPYPFLDTVMKRSYSQLPEFTRGMRAAVPESGGAETKDLPWQAPTTPNNTVSVLGRFADNFVESVPAIGDSWKRWRQGGVQGASDDEVEDPTHLVLTVGAALAGLVAVGGGLLFKSLSPFGASIHRFEPEKGELTGLHRYGEIGAILQGLPAFSSTRDTLYHKGNVDVSVDVSPVPAVPV